MLSILLGPRKNPPHSALERTVGVVVVAVEDSDPGPHEPAAIAAFVHRMQPPWSAGFRLWTSPAGHVGAAAVFVPVRVTVFVETTVFVVTEPQAATPIAPASTSPRAVRLSLLLGFKPLRGSARRTEHRR